MFPTLLAPSLLAGDHAHLAESANLILDCGLNWVHLDIMDGHFVPNLTFGPQTLSDLRKGCSLFFDTHLMLSEPHRYIEAFAQAGADLISIHVEPDYPIEKTLFQIKELGCQGGIALNPKTPAEAALPFLKIVDLVLLMTVEPGFGGQSFDESVLPKITTLNKWRSEGRGAFRLEVDGGVDAQTAPWCRERGSDTLVAGSAFFGAEDRQRFIKRVLA